MDATTILGLKVDLQKYLEQFQECFTRQDTRAHLDKYVGGQLSDLQRKNVEAIALDAGVPVRTLQEFLSQSVSGNVFCGCFFDEKLEFAP